MYYFSESNFKKMAKTNSKECIVKLSYGIRCQVFKIYCVSKCLSKNYDLFKYTLIILLGNFVSLANAQTTLYSTNFGLVANVVPTSWVFNGVNMNISTNTSSSGYPGASGNAYLGEGNSVAFINTSGTTEPSSQIGTSIATLTLNTLGYSSITLSFGMRKSSSGYNANVTYTLEWSSNGTTYYAIPYNEPTAGNWGLVSGSGLTLPVGAGNLPTLFIRWTFVRTGTASNFKIDDVLITGNTLSVNTAPLISVDVSATTDYIDGGVLVAPATPFIVSGVLNDPSDPASSLGIDFLVNDAQTIASNLIVTALSSNTLVVPNANIILTGTNTTRNAKIIPLSTGYSTITLAVSDSVNTTYYNLNYAVSAGSSTPTNTIWHTGISDASNAIALDDMFYLSADDELDVINVYSRINSGLPLTSFSYSAFINLSDPSKPETDLEAATNSPYNSNKKYWLGSMSTGGSAFAIKPNRDRLFATITASTGASTSFSIAGYVSLRSQIIAWGDANGYNFTASAAAGVNSKTIGGYAAEGMVFAPDSTTLYIGFRAPLVPVASRTNAVIVPIINFETWFNNGFPTSNPTFGAPIELNLGLRGIRDLIRLSNGTYIIIAGNPQGSPITSAIFKWSGNPSDLPILVTTTANGILNMEGVMPINSNNQLSMNQLQVISDNGEDVFYADGIQAKDFMGLSLRKFRSDNLTNIDLCLLTSTSTPIISQNALTLTSTSGASYQWFLNNIAIPGATFQNYTVNQNGNYYVSVSNALGCTANSNSIPVFNVGVTSYVNSTNKLIAYPNPFKATTSLQLTLSLDAQIIIEVYDLLGQKITTVTNSNYAAGVYTFEFGAKKLGYTSGVYIIKTFVNGQASVLRVIEND